MVFGINQTSTPWLSNFGSFVLSLAFMKDLIFLVLSVNRASSWFVAIYAWFLNLESEGCFGLFLDYEKQESFSNV